MISLDRVTKALLVAALILGVTHHVDHVLRVDHSGWPFREIVTPFTYSLLAYPVLLFALLGPARLYWMRFGLLVAGAALTLFAHVAIETPMMQYAMWAYNRSLEPHLWAVSNLCGVRSGPLGVLAMAVSMALNIVLVVASAAMLANGLRRARR